MVSLFWYGWAVLMWLARSAARSSTDQEFIRIGQPPIGKNIATATMYRDTFSHNSLTDLLHFTNASGADCKGPGVAPAADGHRDIVGARSERSARDKDRGAEIVERIASALFRHRVGIDVAIRVESARLDRGGCYTGERQGIAGEPGVHVSAKLERYRQSTRRCVAGTCGERVRPFALSRAHPHRRAWWRELDRVGERRRGHRDGIGAAQHVESADTHSLFAVFAVASAA